MDAGWFILVIIPKLRHYVNLPAKRKRESASLPFLESILSGSPRLNCLSRTYRFAGTAINAGFRINYINRIAG